MPRNEQTVTATAGGYVIYENDEHGRPIYIGKDNYWTRVKQAAVPWKTKAEAEAAREQG